MIKKFFLFLGLFVFLFGISNFSFFESGWRSAAGLFSKLLEEKISPDDLRAKYKNGVIRVLIVPGHDNSSPGAVYRGMAEADLNNELARDLLAFFKADPKFNVFITRGEEGDYEDWFEKYFQEHGSDIITLRDYLKRATSFLKSEKTLVEKNKVYHNPAADNISLKLYAINKLADDYKIDIVIHVHLNDYPGRPARGPGKYTGFSIYVPEEQLPNFRVSFSLAEAVKNQLAKYFPISNFPAESSGIVKDQQLIAVGSNASRKGASVLIEYGYIYETQFAYPEARAIIFKSLAEQTYWGIKSFFED